MHVKELGRDGTTGIQHRTPFKQQSTQVCTEPIDTYWSLSKVAYHQAIGKLFVDRLTQCINERTGFGTDMKFQIGFAKAGLRFSSTGSLPLGHKLDSNGGLSMSSPYRPNLRKGSATHLRCAWVNSIWLSINATIKTYCTSASRQ